jgi:hypothetical protein
MLMGGGTFHRDVPSSSERETVQETRQRNFTYSNYASDADAAKHPERREVHKDLNIKGKDRECCDSNEHPDTMPIGLLMDVTKSRGNDAVVVYQKMGGFIGRLILGGIIKHPVICISAFGDASCGDQAPIQVGQFESDARIDDNLKALWLEEGGGGTGQESAELIAYYFARHTQLDCNKRGKKGYVFIFTDEGFYSHVFKDQVKVLIGDSIPQDIPSSLIFQELQKKYNVFVIFPRKSWEERKTDIDKEIADRVTKAGGMIEGVSIRGSLLWNNENDLDLHCITPSGEEIFYGHKNSRCGGYLDVDMNVRGETTKPVENIRWEKGKASKGHYRFFVQCYATHYKQGNNYQSNPASTQFRVEIEIDGKVQHFEGKTPQGATGRSSDTQVFEFDYDPRSGQVEQQDKYALYKDDVVLEQWRSVISREHILTINDPRACVDAMIGAIALTEGAKTLDDYIKELGPKEQGGIIDQTPERCEDVKNALSALAGVSAQASVDVSVFRASGSDKKRGRSKRII